MTSTVELVAIDALGPTGEYRTRAREVITDTAGVAVAELSIVPPPYVSRKREGHARVPSNCVEDGLKLGTWIYAQRKNKNNLSGWTPAIGPLKCNHQENWRWRKLIDNRVWRVLGLFYVVAPISLVVAVD
jgi:hypothetical protein